MPRASRREPALGVVPAVAPLLALGVDVHPSGRLRLHENPNTQAVVPVCTRRRTQKSSSQGRRLGRHTQKQGEVQGKAGRTWVHEAFRAAACCCWTVAGVGGGRGCRHHACRSGEALGRSRAQCNRTSQTPRQHREMAALASTTAAPHMRVDQGTTKQRCAISRKAGVKPRTVDWAPGTSHQVARKGGGGHQARRHRREARGQERGKKSRANRESDGAVAFGDDARVVDVEDT